MFRIHFDPLLGRFIIQVKTGFFWRTAMCLAESNDKTKPSLFGSYDDAMEHVKTIGLHKLYRDGSRNMFDQFLNAGTVAHEAIVSYSALTGAKNA